jgi:predicted secreted protein
MTNFLRSFLDTRTRRAARGGLAVATLVLAAAVAHAGVAAGAAAGSGSGPLVPAAAATPAGVVGLTASATVHVPRDWIAITFSTTRDGTDAQAVQGALRQAVETARSQVPAFRSTEAGQMRTGAFSLQPRYGSKGQITGWTGTATLTVQGTDLPGIAQLVGRIGTLTVANVEMGLAPATREKAEADATAQAIARFRTQSTTAATLFGYDRYELREVAVHATNPGMPRPMMRMASVQLASTEAPPLPVETGDEDVTVNVSGTVQLAR